MEPLQSPAVTNLGGYQPSFQIKKKKEKKKTPRHTPEFSGAETQPPNRERV